MAIPGGNAELNRKVAIKIGADVSGAVSSFGVLGEVVKETTIAFTGLAKVMESAYKTADKTGNALIAMGVGIKGSLTASALSMAKFEQAFVGVRKTVNATEKDLDKLAVAIRRMSTEIPVAATELARVGQVAGQLGIATENMEMFVETAAKLGIATDLSASQAIAGLARIIKVAGESETVVDNLASSLVHLGNTMNTTEPAILDMAQNISGTAGAMGVATDEILGISAAFTAAGIEAEAGGTAINRVFIEMNEAARNSGPNLLKFADLLGVTSQQFEVMFKTDPGGTFAKFTDVLRSAGPEAQTIISGLGFGSLRLARAFGNVANSSTSLSSTIRSSSRAFDENRALNEENAKAVETFYNQLQIFKNTMTELVRGFGGPFLSVLTSTLTSINTLTKFLVNLSQPLKDLFAKFAGLVGGLSIAAGVILKFLIPLGMLRTALGFVGKEAKLSTSLLGNFFNGLIKGNNAHITGKSKALGGLAKALNLVGRSSRQALMGLGSFLKTGLENDFRFMRRAEKVRAGDGKLIRGPMDFVSDEKRERMRGLNPFAGKRNAQVMGEAVAEATVKEQAEQSVRQRAKYRFQQAWAERQASSGATATSGLVPGQNVTPAFNNWLNSQKRVQQEISDKLSSGNAKEYRSGIRQRFFNKERGKFAAATNPFKQRSLGAIPAFPNSDPTQTPWGYGQEDTMRERLKGRAIRGKNFAAGTAKYAVGGAFRAARTGAAFIGEGVTRYGGAALGGLMRAVAPLSIAFMALSAISSRVTQKFEEAAAKLGSVAKHGELFAASMGLATRGAEGTLTAEINPDARLKKLFGEDLAPLVERGREALADHGDTGLRTFLDRMQIDLQQQGNSPEEARKAAADYLRINFPDANPNLVRSVDANDIGDVYRSSAETSQMLEFQKDDRKADLNFFEEMWHNVAREFSDDRNTKGAGAEFQAEAMDIASAGMRAGERSSLLELLTYGQGMGVLGEDGANAPSDFNQAISDEILKAYPGIEGGKYDVSTLNGLISAMEEGDVLNKEDADLARGSIGKFTTDDWLKISESANPMETLKQMAPAFSAAMEKQFPMEVIGPRYEALRKNSQILQDLPKEVFARTGVTPAEREKALSEGLRSQQMEKSDTQMFKQLQSLTKALEKGGNENSDLYAMFKDMERQYRQQLSAEVVSNLSFSATAGGMGSAAQLAQVRSKIATVSTGGDQENLELLDSLQAREEQLQQNSVNKLMNWANRRKQIMSDLNDSESQINRNRQRQFADFETSIARQIEDASRALASSMDPYTRTTANRGYGGHGLALNTSFQSREMERQIAELKRLKDLGLSDEALEFYDFGNVSNSGAVSTTLKSAEVDASIIADLNAEAAKRNKLGGQLYEFNRAEMDRNIDRQYDDMAKAFARQKFDLFWQLDKDLIEPELADIDEALAMAHATGDAALIAYAEAAKSEWDLLQIGIEETEESLLNTKGIDLQIQRAESLEKVWQNINALKGDYLSDSSSFGGGGSNSFDGPEQVTAIAYPGTQTAPVVTDGWDGRHGTEGAARHSNTFFTNADIGTISNSAARGRASNVQLMINAAATKHGLNPSLLAALVQQESGFDPNAVSHAGAMGLGQLMPGTAKDLGVTDPFDPEQNLDGAARYLAAQIEKFGSIELGLAAYNAGPGNVRKYGGIPPFKETQDYVRKVTAGLAGFSEDEGLYTTHGGTRSAASYNYEVGMRSHSMTNPNGVVSTSISTTTYTGDIKVETSSVADFEKQMAEKKRRQQMTRPMPVS